MTCHANFYFAFVMTRQFLFVGFLVLSSTYAFVKGGRPERIGAATLILGVAASLTVARPAAVRFHGLEAGILLVDTIMLSIFLCLSVRSTRFWPIWMAAMLGAEIAIHATRMIVPTVMPAAYLHAVALWSWVAQLMLMVATWRHCQRLKGQVADACWRD